MSSPISHIATADLSYSSISPNTPGEARNQGFVGWLWGAVNARKNTNSASSLKTIISKDEIFMAYLTLPAWYLIQNSLARRQKDFTWV